ncbi:MAG: UDP-N-acetylmuramate dehydrogenase [Acidimicrobiia bacterium]|nr:UDP-N-acetylmuramate dehydrogenase [Acidimicrobiia bacterium]
MSAGRVNGDTADVAAVAARLSDALPGHVHHDVPARELTTYRLGGPVAALVRLRSEEDLRATSKAMAGTDVPVLVIGRGSNIVVADEGFPGVGLILEGEFDHIDIAEDRVRAGGSVPLPVLARRAAAAGRAGLEFYVGIPGSVGGAVRMNAGGHGRSTADVLIEARLVDLSTGAAADLVAEDLVFGYRTSAVTKRQVVVGAVFDATSDTSEACEERLAEIVRWRRENQPGGSNAGSVFTNPPGDSAGRLIDDCGLKGFRVGGVEVSHKHANFFQADTDARAADVHALVAEVRRVVAERTGIDLRPELVFVGFDDENRCGDTRP